MMKTYKKTKTLCFILIVQAINAQAYACQDLGVFTALIGSWQEKKPDGLTIESWIKTSDHTIEGFGATYYTNMQEKNSEALRIVEMSGEVFYLAKVKGNQFPVAFKLIECTKDRFRFENQQHDFPQQIIYEIHGKNQLRVMVRSSNSAGFVINFERIKD